MNSDYGLLINNNTKLHRRYFDEMARLLGIKVIYRAPKASKTYTTYSEIESNYEKPKPVFCIFDEHPNQQTLKKLGWMSELQESPSLISVSYDLEGLQQGALFIVPSAIEEASGRLFRVTKIATTMIYPASITCEIVPEYIDTYEPALSTFKNSSFNLLNDEDEGL